MGLSKEALWDGVSGTRGNPSDELQHPVGHSGFTVQRGQDYLGVLFALT
jgi:hypothetical protein